MWVIAATLLLRLRQPPWPSATPELGVQDDSGPMRSVQSGIVARAAENMSPTVELRADGLLFSLLLFEGRRGVRPSATVGRFRRP